MVKIMHEHLKILIQVGIIAGIIVLAIGILQLQFYLQAHELDLAEPLYSTNHYFWITEAPNLQDNFPVYFNLTPLSNYYQYGFSQQGNLTKQNKIPFYNWTLFINQKPYDSFDIYKVYFADCNSYSLRQTCLGNHFLIDLITHSPNNTIFTLQYFINNVSIDNLTTSYIYPV